MKWICEFSLHFFQKWASIGWLDTPLAKTLTLYLQCYKGMTFFGKLPSVFVNHRDILVISIVSITTEEEAEERNLTLPSTGASFCPWGLGRGENESVRGRMLFFWNTQQVPLQRRDAHLQRVWSTTAKPTEYCSVKNADQTWRKNCSISDQQCYVPCCSWL